MTWREQFIARILLIIARMVADDPVLRDDLKNLANHASVHAPKLETAA